MAPVKEPLAMQLTIRDVARLCDVSESQVFQWVQEDGLPAERVNDLCRVNSAELLEWATARKMAISPAVFQTMNGGSAGGADLASALALGGLVHGVQGADRGSVLAQVVDSLVLPDRFDRSALLQLLLARESLGGTAVGGGIAIPHPRRPLILPGARPVVRLCFLAGPIDFGGAGGDPVDTLFLLICPTVRDHLQMLARLASVLRDESFRRLLRQRPPLEAIVQEVRRVEATFRPAA